MKRREQKAFVRDLLKTIGDSIVAQIDTGKVPADWDGRELRTLIALVAERETTMGGDKRNWRYRAFQNTVLVNNL